MILASDSDTEIEGTQARTRTQGVDERLAGSAYRESLMSIDGFTRDHKGRVKFNKDTKKRRREAEEDIGIGEDGDVDMDMGDASASASMDKHKKLKRKESSVRIGQEFKAKVSLVVIWV